MLDVEKFFDDLSVTLYSRPEALEAALTSGAQEHWLATEASILLHSKRDEYGIGGVLPNRAECIPKWWIAREAGLVDLFVAPEKPDCCDEKIAFAFEFKVIRSESNKCKGQLDDLWWQISGERRVHRNYDGVPIKWYGIILAFDNHYAPGYSRVKKLNSLYGADSCSNNFFDMIWGEDEPYDNWVVSKGWEVWSCASSKFRQYLDIQKKALQNYSLYRVTLVMQ